MRYIRNSAVRNPELFAVTDGEWQASPEPSLFALTNDFSPRKNRVMDPNQDVLDVIRADPRIYLAFLSSSLTRGRKGYAGCAGKEDA